eukprot:c32501_g1_i1.p1 GENE.c32501_g1_i1~~c32501_g1_i1.p1  ORF type:complete len:235 (-),score=23.00 c32501_g1_i1:105-809(-)
MGVYLFGSISFCDGMTSNTRPQPRRLMPLSHQANRPDQSPPDNYFGSRAKVGGFGAITSPMLPQPESSPRLDSQPSRIPSMRELAGRNSYEVPPPYVDPPDSDSDRDRRSSFASTDLSSPSPGLSRMFADLSYREPSSTPNETLRHSPKRPAEDSIAASRPRVRRRSAPSAIQEYEDLSSTSQLLMERLKLSYADLVQIKAEMKLAKARNAKLEAEHQRLQMELARLEVLSPWI